MPKRLGINVLLLLSSLVAPVTAPAEEWLYCMAPKPGQNIGKYFQGDRILCHENKSSLVSINARDVTEIAYDFTTLASPHPHRLHWSDVLGGEGFGIIFGPVAMAIESLSLEIENSIRLRRHPYVFVRWSNEREQGIAVFQICHESAVLPFLSKVREMTRREWSNRERDRQTIRREPEQNAEDRRFRVRLDRGVRIGQTNIVEGTYEAHVWNGESAARTVLYLHKHKSFGGTKTVAEVPIDILQLAEPNKGFTVVYGRNKQGAEMVAEIRTARTVIRLRND